MTFSKWQESDVRENGKNVHEKQESDVRKNGKNVHEKQESDVIKKSHWWMFKIHELKSEQ